jgi:hypothetical protein
VAPAGLGLLVEGLGGSTVLLGGYPALLGRRQPRELLRAAAEHLTPRGNASPSTRPVSRRSLPVNGRDLDLHPDGRRLAVACADSVLRVYDLGPKPAAPAKK